MQNYCLSLAKINFHSNEGMCKFEMFARRLSPALLLALLMVRAPGEDGGTWGSVNDLFKARVRFPVTVTVSKARRMGISLHLLRASFFFVTAYVTRNACEILGCPLALETIFHA